MLQSLWKCYHGQKLDVLNLFEKGPAGSPDMSVFPISFAVTLEGDLWALLTNNQLLCYHTNSLGKYGKSFYPLDNTYRFRIEGCLWWRDQLWLYGRGLFTFQAGKLQELEGLLSDEVHSIFIDAQHRLVLCFAEAGIWCSRDGLEWDSIRLPPEEKRLYTCASDAVGNL